MSKSVNNSYWKHGLTVTLIVTEIHFYHWRELPQVSFLLWQTRVCRDKTRLLLWQKYACRDKLLSWQAYFCRNIVATNSSHGCRDKTCVMTKMILVAAPADDTLFRRVDGHVNSGTEWILKEGGPGDATRLTSKAEASWKDAQLQPSQVLLLSGVSEHAFHLHLCLLSLCCHCFFCDPRLKDHPDITALVDWA